MNLTCSEPAHVRWLIPRDLPAVLHIDEQCYQWDAWNEADFRSALRTLKTILMVAEVEEAVAGFMAFHLGDSFLQLMRLGVAPGWRRMGVGRALLAALASRIGPSKMRDRVIAYVPEIDLRPQLFFRGCGLRADGIGYDCEGQAYYRFVLKRPAPATGAAIQSED